MTQLEYTMFITNNHDSFHLWWQEDFVKRQNVSKYYDQDCMKNSLLLFIPFYQLQLLKIVIFWAGIFFIFLKNVIEQTWKVFNTKFGPQWKDRKSSYQDLKSPNCQANHIWRGLGRVRGKILFAETILAKIFQTNFSFCVK